MCGMLLSMAYQTQESSFGLEAYDDFGSDSNHYLNIFSMIPSTHSCSTTIIYFPGGMQTCQKNPLISLACFVFFSYLLKDEVALYNFSVY